MDRSGAASLDIIIPLYNEEEMLELLAAELSRIFTAQALAERRLSRIRYLMIDDGSRDGTASAVSARIAQGFPAVLYRLSRNFGHQNAVCAGLDHADADLVAVIDADLQDPPELILQMVDRWREGSDVIYAERRKRKESALKRLGYWAFYRIVAHLSDVHMPLDSGDFCLMDRQVVRALAQLPENLRFVRGLRAWVGFRQTGIAFDRPARIAGRTKYSLGKLYKLATDGIASFSIRPLKLAQLLSFSYFMLSMGITIWLLVQLLWGHQSSVSPWTLLTYLLIVSGNGALCLCVYILGAYVGRTYLEVKQRPPYILREIVRIDDRAPAKPGLSGAPHVID